MDRTMIIPQIVTIVCVILTLAYTIYDHHFLPRPNLVVAALPENQTGYCRATVINFGDAATDVEVTACLIEGSITIQTINKEIGTLPAAEKFSPVCSNPEVFYFDKAEKGKKYKLIFVVKCKEGVFQSEMGVRW